MAKTMTQVKFTIDADIVSTFKARCKSQGVSMASVINQFMKTCKPNHESTKINLQTRPMRRKAAMETLDILSELLALEEQYRDSIPEQFTQRYDAADHACVQIANAIGSLEDAF